MNIADFYDHVVTTTQKQGRLLPFTDLYGDGSRWGQKLLPCLKTYQALRQIMVIEGLIDADFKVI